MVEVAPDQFVNEKAARALGLIRDDAPLDAGGQP